MATREEVMRRAEERWTQWVPRDEYLVIRVDGRAFHTFTKGMGEPFSFAFMGSMDRVAAKLCEEIQGAVLAFVQSDEISVLVKPVAGIVRNSGQWFGGSVRKILSVSAGLASSTMAHEWASPETANPTYDPDRGFRIPHFDSRILTFPDRDDAIRYFLWRQGDCARNAIQACAQFWIGHKKIHGKDRVQQLVMLEHAGIDYEATVPQGFRLGRTVLPYEVPMELSYVHKGTGETMTAQVVRNEWRAAPAPWFDWDQAGFLNTHIPTKEDK